MWDCNNEFEGIMHAYFDQAFHQRFLEVRPKIPNQIELNLRVNVNALLDRYKA